MELLRQARAIVAERVIAAQRREILALQAQNHIYGGRLAIATAWRSPYFGVTLAIAFYLGSCLLIDYFDRKRKATCEK